MLVDQSYFQAEFSLQNAAIKHVELKYIEKIWKENFEFIPAFFS
jgi:hypothetical protein